MLERIWRLLGYDIVIVLCTGGPMKRYVHWYLGRPFIYTHGSDTITELLPDGTCEGISFAKRWKALTPGIQEWGRRNDLKLNGKKDA